MYVIFPSANIIDYVHKLVLSTSIKCIDKVDNERYFDFRPLIGMHLSSMRVVVANLEQIYDAP